MAKTRTAIKSAVIQNTGRSDKETLIENACDEALKLAVSLHPFRDATSVATDIAITTAAITASLATITNLAHIVSARVIETGSNASKKLAIVNRVWWDRNVINAAGNSNGWPESALRDGSLLYLDRPALANLNLRLRVATFQSFTTDATVCPISILDNFIVDWATYSVFMAIQNFESAAAWKIKAVGPAFDNATISEGQRIGGSLKMAIDGDYDIAEEMTFTGPNAQAEAQQGIVIENLDTGEVDLWY